MSTPADAPSSPRSMTFWAHLAELRARLGWSALAVLVASVAAYVYREPLYALLAAPLLAAQPGIKLNYFSPTEPFFVFIRIAVSAGVAAASPFVLYQLWAFIAPGLTRRERRAVLPVLPVVLGLFAAGVLFVYFWLLPAALKFLIGFAPPQLEPEINQERYFGFITAMCLAGGLLFELPTVLGVLGFLGLVTARLLLRYTGQAVVALMILAAVITPSGDAFTMLALTAPLVVLYLLSILVVWLIERRRSAAAA